MRAISGNFSLSGATRYGGALTIPFCAPPGAGSTVGTTTGDVIMGDVAWAFEGDDATDRDFRGAPACIVNILDTQKEDKTTGGYEWERKYVTGITYPDRLEISWGIEGSNVRILKIGFLVMGL